MLLVLHERHYFYFYLFSESVLFNNNPCKIRGSYSVEKSKGISESPSMTIALLGVKYPFRQPVSMSLNNEIQGVFYLSMQTLIRDTGDTVISDQKSVI